jgi:hypothetical protein
VVAKLLAVRWKQNENLGRSCWATRATPSRSRNSGAQGLEGLTAFRTWIDEEKCALKYVAKVCGKNFGKCVGGAVVYVVHTTSTGRPSTEARAS